MKESINSVLYFLHVTITDPLILLSIQCHISHDIEVLLRESITYPVLNSTWDDAMFPRLFRGYS